MKNIFNYKEFIKEEFVADYKFTKDKEGDKKHDRLASKEKDGHKWKGAGNKKNGDNLVKNFKCECGYKKSSSIDEKGKKTVVTYSK